MNKKSIRNAETFDELLDIKYGKAKAKKRVLFEKAAYDFLIKENIVAKTKR